MLLVPAATALAQGFADSDGDGRPDNFDNCPAVANADQTDGDGDGVGYACDSRQVPPGAKTTSGTVPPGGSINTGSDPSASNPVVVKVTTKRGGTLYIDEIRDPKRPGVSEEAEGSERDAKDWFGSAFRITPPYFDYMAGGERQFQFLTAEWLIHGPAVLTYLPPYPEVADFRSPSRDAREPCYAGATGAEPLKQQWLPNGDVRITVGYRCTVYPFTSHWFNPAWGINRQTSGVAGPVPNRESTLDEVLKAGRVWVNIDCSLRCDKSATVTIAAATARKLGLKSNVIGGGRIPAPAAGAPYQEPRALGALTKKARKALRRANKITMKVKWKAVGPRKGQAKSGTWTIAFKAKEADDDIR
jgi:hypothetical protein